jgi:hypothetical protein
MLVILRVLFGAALVYELIEGAKAAPATIPVAGDVTPAFYLMVCVGLGILNAIVWAPYLGSIVSTPLTGMISGSDYVDRTNWVVRLLHWLENRHRRRATVAIAFWEAVRHPKAPTAFVIGLRNARRGSWFEKIFAREVFRFNNTQNCVQAYLALKRHGIDPRPHPSQEVNIMLLSLERPPRTEPEIVAVPTAPKAAPLKRNPQIRLFRHAPSLVETEAQAEPVQTSDPAAAESSTAEAGGTETVVEQGVGEPRGFSSVFARVAEFLRTH